MTPRRISAWILAFDLIWIALALGISFVIRYGLDWGIAGAPFLSLAPFLIATCVVWTFLSSTLNLDGFHGGWRLPAVVSHVVSALLCTMAILLALAYLAIGVGIVMSHDPLHRPGRALVSASGSYLG